MILAIILAGAVGTLGGLIRARRASMMNPVEALRSHSRDTYIALYFVFKY